MSQSNPSMFKLRSAIGRQTGMTARGRNQRWDRCGWCGRKSPASIRAGKNWLERLEGAAMNAAEAIKAARDAGIELGIDGDDLVLEASASPPAAVLDLLSRHKTEVLVVLAAKLLAPTLISESPAESAEGEPGHEQPCAARRGRVQELDGVFLHFCVECGRFGSYVMASVCARVSWAAGIAAIIDHKDMTHKFIPWPRIQLQGSPRSIVGPKPKPLASGQLG
jgi:hypothetical protein